MRWNRLKFLILMKFYRLLRLWNKYYPTRGISVDWKISKEQRLQLRSLKESPGWKLYSAKLKEQVVEVQESLEVTSEVDQMMRLQGQLRGLRQVSSLVEDLLEVDEIGREGILERKVREEVEELAVLLGVNPRTLEVPDVS